MRWLAWGVLVAVLGAVVVWGLDAVFDHDVPVWVGALAGLVAIVPFVLSLRWPPVARAADPTLVATLSVGALLAIVAAVYAIVVLLAGRAPTSDERWFLGLALIVVVVAALAYRGLQPRIDWWARHLVYRDRAQSADLSRTF